MSRGKIGGQDSMEEVARETELVRRVSHFSDQRARPTTAAAQTSLGGRGDGHIAETAVAK